MSAQMSAPEGPRSKASATASAAPGPIRDELSAYHLIDERRLVGGLIERAVYTEDERRRIADIARRLVHAARVPGARPRRHRRLHARVRPVERGGRHPDVPRRGAAAHSRYRDPDALIAEKIGEGQWDKHLGQSDSLFVNASTWGLMLTGRVVKLGASSGRRIRRISAGSSRAPASR